MKKISRTDIFNFVRHQYHTTPDYPWTKSPKFAVLRHNDTNKWYGLIMNLPRHLVGMDGDEIVDVLNVKCDPILMGALLASPGYRPAYHMSKSNWISVILDGSVKRDEVLNLIKISYSLTDKKSGQK